MSRQVPPSCCESNRSARPSAGPTASTTNRSRPESTADGTPGTRGATTCQIPPTIRRTTARLSTALGRRARGAGDCARRVSRPGRQRDHEPRCQRQSRRRPERRPEREPERRSGIDPGRAAGRTVPIASRTSISTGTDCSSGPSSTGSRTKAPTPNPPTTPIARSSGATAASLRRRVRSGWIANRRRAARWPRGSSTRANPLPAPTSGTTTTTSAKQTSTDR